MATKEILLQHAITKFTQLGSKHVTLDEIADDLGISKKTIYTFFKTKGDLVTASVMALLDEYQQDINAITDCKTTDALLKVILIYKRGFEYIAYFKPSFLSDLSRYYPKANKAYTAFLEKLSKVTVYNLLAQAQEAGNIRSDINVSLVVAIYFTRIDLLVLGNNNLIAWYGKEATFHHLVISNLRGIISPTYTNEYFQSCGN